LFIALILLVGCHNMTHQYPCLVLVSTNWDVAWHLVASWRKPKRIFV